MKTSTGPPDNSQSATTRWREGADALAPVVSLRGVTVHFGERMIFDRLDLTVAEGESLAVMGSSGSGKSTLLKVIVGTLLPECGSIQVFGEELTRLDHGTLSGLRMKIGMVFQYSALISSLTVRGNLALPLEELTEKSREEIDHIIAEKLEFVGLPETTHMMPHELSGGMQKRIAIARALVLEPELLLFDEPTAGLDPISSHRIDELILRLNRETRVSQIIVCHRMENAFRVATRLAILDEGTIVSEGPLSEVKDSTVPILGQFLAGMSAHQLERHA
jgi:phospholipid/cholesterol/gamma-HCH transport system ATP-binding protein